MCFPATLHRCMTKQLWITDKVRERLMKLRDEHSIKHLEALSNVILILALTDEALIKRAVSLIKAWDLDKGAERLGKEHML